MSAGWFVSYAALWIMVVFQGLLSLALLKQLSELLQLSQQQELGEGNPIETGASAPDFSGVEVYSGRRVSRRTIDNRGVVVLFLSPQCSVCKDLVASMEPVALDGLPPIVAFCRGSERACGPFAKRFSVKSGALVADAEVAASRYRAARVPTAVAVGGDGMIRGYAHPKNIEDLRKLNLRVRPNSSLGTQSKSELSSGVQEVSYEHS